jgi:hypothetical protein
MLTLYSRLLILQPEEVKSSETLQDSLMQSRVEMKLRKRDIRHVPYIAAQKETQMKTTSRFLFSHLGMAALTVISLLHTAPCATSAVQTEVPQGTTFPVRFVRSVDSRRAEPGDRVTAKTLQVVILPGGQHLPKGTLLVGHVVNARPYHFNPEPYAGQKASSISIHFDQIVNGESKLPVNLSVRALANTLQSEWAPRVHYHDETDGAGSMILIGGLEFSPFDKTVRDDDGDVIAYNRKNGVFARLLAPDKAASMRADCSATSTEQSVAIFSPDACGLYGFGRMSMPHAGRSGSGTFTLVSRSRSIKLYAGSTALLQETEGPLAQK